MKQVIEKTFKALKASGSTKKEKLNSPYSSVELYHWSPNDGSVNFGDKLSEIVTRQVLSTVGLTLDDEVSVSSRIFAIGSVLHFTKTNDHIWGSGWNGKIPETAFKAKNLNVHAVRGPLTAEFLSKHGIHVPEVYGDPALLVPHLFPNRFKISKEYDYVFVPNLHDCNLVINQPNVVSPLQGWNVVIDSILRAKLVLSSSLHGLILAEAYGIPALYVRLTETENLFKYKDYYLGTGRKEVDFRFANSIEEGLNTEAMKPVVFNKQKLLSAFPLHLWNSVEDLK